MVLWVEKIVLICLVDVILEHNHAQFSPACLAAP